MTQLNTRPADVISGLQRIDLIPTNEVDDVDDVSAGSVGDLSLTGTGQVITLDISRETSEFIQEQKRGLHGVYYDQRLELFIPGTETALLAKLRALEMKNLFAIIYFYEQEGYDPGDLPVRWLCGNCDTDTHGRYIGMEMRFKTGSRKKVNELKGYTITLNCESRYQAPRYTGEEIPVS